jgi:hypothetical protein
VAFEAIAQALVFQLLKLQSKIKSVPLKLLLTLTTFFHRQLIKNDPRAEARIGERLPYVGNYIFLKKKKTLKYIKNH